mgnify:CR=1 FL=1
MEGTFQSDDRMPASVHAELVAGFAALSAVEPRDWHPGSGERMLDLEDALHERVIGYVCSNFVSIFGKL